MGKAVALLLGLVVSTVVYGFVLKTLWWWFAVPVFALPEISVVQAIGIGLAARFFTGTSYVLEQMNRANKDLADARNIAESIVMGVVHPLLALAIGWVVTLFL